ncbi:HD domain-containing protein [Thiomonas sp. FB-Cd]|uniref:HD domain-containing protein n=1 Tax=Thiomonas sp. FB-Cd TaxID=1158292 RepID=UPI0004DF5988|nr:HD domain-containing protein [Thiomonas sp. FB-Cd]
MHCVFISNCEQRALPRTRALVDRYAQRIGDRAWATRMTDAGLEELRLALRRRATRQTSIACYRSDATLGLRLLWIVGNKSAYDSNGWFAASTQHRKKGFPMPFRHACLVAELAGYAHDFGKASQRFQSKLAESTQGGAAQADVIRHEWLSAWLLSTILKRDDGAMTPSALAQAWGEMARKENANDGPANPWQPPVPELLMNAMDAALWGVCTHHGAMGGALENPHGLTGDAHIRTRQSEHIDLSTRWKHLVLAQPDFANGPSQDARRWVDLLSRMDRVRGRLQDIDRTPAYWEGVMLVARAALIFADHKVSSRTFDGDREAGILYANTKATPVEAPKIGLRGARKPKKDKKEPPRFLDQPLSWHLTEVGSHAAANVRMFIGEDLPTVDRDLVQSVLDSRAEPGSRFAWQDLAMDHVAALQGGKLVFNVASTGAGKTLANLKMALAMRPQGARLAVAFNLRSLTTQTFAAFGKFLVNEPTSRRDFACLLGDRGAVGMDFSREDEDDVDHEDRIDLEGAQNLDVPDWLSRIATHTSGDDKLAKLIASPVLVSTMDWIVASGEPGQQDRHAKALIRVTSSDLILDEVDSYDVRATVAVMRVVQAAASFGRNVIVSSATLSPNLARGIALAYASGRRVHDALFGASPWHLVLTSDQFEPTSIPCPHVDDADRFYRTTMQAMARGLCASPGSITKRYRLAGVNTRDDFTPTILREALALHDTHAFTPPGLACRLSIGLVRVANVGPCMDIAEALRADGRFVVTAYHARDVAQRRAIKERWLDTILSRGDDQWVDALIQACPWIQSAEGDVRLVVVATPVEEVGRDHDFDWAIIEPSSMHSIIQTAGRVNRHRRLPIQEGMANVVLLSRNLRSFDGKDVAFTHPGLEVIDDRAGSSHASHDLTDLMRHVGAVAPTDVMDAALVFDEGGRQTLFSACDEQAIAWQVAQSIRVIARAPGFETHFLLKKFETQFPLRDRDTRVHYILDLARWTFLLDGASRTVAGPARVFPNPQNTWLCPDMASLAGQELRFSLRAPVKEVDVHWNGLATPA